MIDVIGFFAGYKGAKPADVATDEAASSRHAAGDNTNALAHTWLDESILDFVDFVDESSCSPSGYSMEPVVMQQQYDAFNSAYSYCRKEWAYDKDPVKRLECFALALNYSLCVNANQNIK